MPNLDWIGKDKVINHHNDVPFKVLNRIYSYDENGIHNEDNNSKNMIIHGDNLEALKSLKLRFANSIDCIYIDPPYNTAHSTNNNQRWVYNDNLDHPIFKAWIGQVVGDEGEDLSRHDKWLCMMYPRLKLLWELLSYNGVIFISIDSAEVFNLKLICDEVFGRDNFIAMLSIENNPKGRKNSNFISVSSEYLVIYAKDKSKSYFVENIPKNASDLTLDENGRYVHNSGKRVLVGENDFNDPVTDFSSDKHYSVYHNPITGDLQIKKETELNEGDPLLSTLGYTRYYSYSDDHFVLNTYSQSKFEDLYNSESLDFKNGKIYEKNYSTTIRMKSLITNREYDAIVNNEKVKYKIDVKTTSAGTELKNIFGVKKIPFENPKNIGLLKLIITLFENKNILVLDSFAGSGTTAHAVLQQNAIDGGERSFIIIEMMDYADSITAERIKRVIGGYGKGKDHVDGVPGSFSYYEIGEPILVDNKINENISVNELRKYIYYTETRQPVPVCLSDEPYCLGIYMNTAYYFYYENSKITTLNRDFLHTIKSKADSYVIYADVCTLNNRELEKYNIVFKKLPRDISKC